MIDFHRLGKLGRMEVYIIFEVFKLLVFKSSISKFFNLKNFFFYHTKKRGAGLIYNKY
jgi:hypothetical protein